MPNNSKSFSQLRDQYPVFYYHGFSHHIQDGNFKMHFRFQMGDQIVFEPILEWPNRDFYQWHRYSPKQLDLLVFHCGLVELISYWKAACPPKVCITCANLSSEQIQWWKKLYFNGLGEFFYVNDIQVDIDNFMEIVCEPQAPAMPLERFELDDAVLIPVGGGKDSVVTLELLRSYSHQRRPLIINPRGASLACAQIAGYQAQQIVEIQRQIDPKLLQLNAQGFLNGHTPFSAMLAFTSLMAAVATGYRYVALSNENSANEPTLEGSHVNHQYSKSFEFESDFREYVKTFVTPDIEYFSFLRPLSELAIAELFAKQEAYHKVFRSCNVGSKDDIWCGHCPKCLFAFIILSPYIAPERLKILFGRDLLDELSMKPFFNQLCGIDAVKPFECVGTTAEVNAALQMRLHRFPESLPALLHYYALTPLAQQSTGHIHDDFNSGHALSAPFLKCHPSYDQFSVALIGMGKEGRSSYHYLRHQYPHAKLVLADQNNDFLSSLPNDPNVDICVGADYLSAFNDQSLIMLSPGVSLKDFPDLEQQANLSSQTNEFLRRWAQNVIAITGTKGKSTTSTLIYHIIKAHTDDVLLLGNMGFPLLDAADKMNADTMVVCELSSHQLQYIQRSPHIAVLLNLFEEHLDHYRSFEEYQWAKWQIAQHQTPEDIFIYNASDPRIKDILKSHPIRSQLKPVSLIAGDSPSYFIEGEQVMIDGRPWASKSEISILPGEHNLFNVLCAIRVARLLEIPDMTIKSALATFKALPHRLQDLGVIRGIRFVNDSISTIPEACMAAIRSFDKVETLIVGGFDRGVSYEPLYHFLQTQPIRTILFVGQAGARMLQEMPGDAYSQAFFCKDYKEVLGKAFEHTPQGGTCLLSPAASSYDQFKNFEERGQYFEDLIHSY